MDSAIATTAEERKLLSTLSALKRQQAARRAARGEEPTGGTAMGLNTASNDNACESGGSTDTTPSSNSKRKPAELRRRPSVKERAARRRARLQAGRNNRMKLARGNLGETEVPSMHPSLDRARSAPAKPASASSSGDAGSGPPPRTSGRSLRKRASRRRVAKSSSVKQGLGSTVGVTRNQPDLTGGSSAPTPPAPPPPPPHAPLLRSKTAPVGRSHTTKSPTVNPLGALHEQERQRKAFSAARLWCGRVHVAVLLIIALVTGWCVSECVPTIPGSRAGDDFDAVQQHRRMVDGDVDIHVDEEDEGFDAFINVEHEHSEFVEQSEWEGAVATDCTWLGEDLRHGWVPWGVLLIIGLRLGVHGIVVVAGKALWPVALSEAKLRFVQVDIPSRLSIGSLLPLLWWLWGAVSNLRRDVGITIVCATFAAGLRYAWFV